MLTKPTLSIFYRCLVVTSLGIVEKRARWMCLPVSWRCIDPMHDNRHWWRSLQGARGLRRVLESNCCYHTDTVGDSTSFGKLVNFGSSKCRLLGRERENVNLGSGIDARDAEIFECSNHGSSTKE